MNIMMVAAVAGHGSNPGLPCQEGTLFCLFLAIAGLMLLTAAALLVRREAPRDAVRYARSHRRTNGL
ncbi:MAG: hypothetical protein HYV14_09615 [Elusimicrobia bacterium]|nr:hypothetical protein [Elusimicrobiota bacterium]